MMPVPTLYLIPVPLADIPPAQVLPAHNLATVASLRHFIVENVRSARRFLRRCDPAAPIDEMSFEVLNVDTPEHDVARMLEPMRKGCDMGVISEAGCPAVADPGALAVAEARRNGWRVVPLVGPSSIIMALMASGLNGQSFTFHGYLPVADKERAAALRRLAEDARRANRTQIFIETPYRNQRMLETIVASVPARTRVCVAQDITGPDERIVTLTAAQWAKQPPLQPKLPAIFLML